VSEPVWVIKAVVLAIHGEQLAEHGGQTGLRDEGLFESAIERPRNLLAYERPDLFDLAAAYAFGIARNHPFIDGNKRVSLVVCETFLALNGYDIDTNDEDLLRLWLKVSTGEINERDLADYLRGHGIGPPFR
jgi:death-on-curing protein